MLDRLTNPDGTFIVTARLALAAVVVTGFAAGYAARPAGDGATTHRASATAQSRIEADVAAQPGATGPALDPAPGLPGLAAPGRATRRALPVETETPTPTATATPEPEATAQPVEAPLETPAPAATPAPPRPAPPAATPAPPPSTSFDSSG